MPDFPLLPMSPAAKGPSPKPPRFVPRTFALEPGHQQKRIGPKFTHLQSALADDGTGLRLQEDPASIAPERAIVFEIAGKLDDFHALVRRTEGLEFLAEDEVEFQPDHDFFESDNRSGREGKRRMDRSINGRLYLAMPNVNALKELLSLWEHWQNRTTLPHGLTAWRDLFATLRDIRPWGVEDRLTDETIEVWKNLAVDSSNTRRIEAEMWFFQEKSRREEAFRRLSKAVSDAGGRIIHHAIIEEIGYDAALIEVASSELQRLVEREGVHLVVCDDIMFLRPQSSVDIFEPSGPAAVQPAEELKLPNDLPPVAALLDGIPIQQHNLLAGRLDVDDPDEIESTSIIGERDHGTKMASLILHGDRNGGEAPLARKLHVRPILFAPSAEHLEVPKQDRLFIDSIYRAVKRMKEGEAGDEPTAPDVFLVNLSICDRNRSFSGSMSPWARLLDYLAEKYGILFFVSAGNILRPLTIRKISSWSGFEDAEPEKREVAVLLALNDQKAHRTLLSPAEALNAVTVGARHDDAHHGPRGAGSVDPYIGRDLPNVSSALGLGHRKVIKPDIHMPGGRENVRFNTLQGPLTIVPTKNNFGHGLKAAAPDELGNRDREALISGTSAATALATRAAHQLFDALMDRSGGSLHSHLAPEFYAVVIKALLIHRSKWGNYAQLLEKIYEPHGPGKHIERRDNITRLLGYGFPVIEEALSCASHRATLLGFGMVKAHETNIHRIPLPSTLENMKVWREITVTVAWFSPINPRHAVYRQANLELKPAEMMTTTIAPNRASGQPSDRSVPRGTVFHARYEGSQAVSFVADGYLVLRIHCREQAGRLDQSIRYGIAVTIEADRRVPVYEEVRTRLAVAIQLESAGKAK